MTWRTPSSLKWLIEKRSRLAGKLIWTEERLQRTHQRLKQLEEDLATTCKRLQAIDIAIGIHEIPIDPTGLRTIRPSENKFLLPPGHLSRILRKELGARDNWVDTRELTTVVYGHLNAIGSSHDIAFVSLVVRRCLNGLYHRGSVVRHLPLNEQCRSDGTTLALWSLPGREAPAYFGQRANLPGVPKARSRRA